MTSSNINFSAWVKQVQKRTELTLRHILNHALIKSPSKKSSAEQKLQDAINYSTLGGKRVRALMVHAAGKLTNADPALLELASSAIELIHAYSLVHDDLPAMDNDELRRGKPTVHKVYGEALAILTGSALQALAFSSLVNSKMSPNIITNLIKELAYGAQAIVIGQAMDLASANFGVPIEIEQLQKIYNLKTGALIHTAIRMGLSCGDNSLPVNNLDTNAKSRIHHYVNIYANNIGLAFQVVDDILDVSAEVLILGKTPGKDAANNKPTYVSCLGLDAARSLVQNLLTEAELALDEIEKIFVATSSANDYSKGSQTVYLRKLAGFIVLRNH